MKLKLSNIGMINRADIRLDGLTIIAGENDTGKSTVGKIIFSLIKALNRYEQDLNEGKSNKILRLIDRTYFQLRKQYDFSENIEVKKAFYPPTFFRYLKSNQDEENIDLIDKKIHLLRKIDALDAIKNLEAIKKIYTEDEENKETIVKRALTKAFISEFYFELTPKNSSLISKISLFDGTNILFEAALNNNAVEDLTLYDDLYFNDVTYIETPIFLQMSELIRSASNLFEITERNGTGLLSSGRIPTVALHIKDLISKLENAQYFQTSSLFEGTLLHVLADISSVVKGSGFTFDKEKRDFYFEKNNGTKFKSTNTATGLKSFGMLQLLIQANILNERSLLIIDEPEIHLHPKWQVEYAKLIVSLVKNDIPVLVTSHSPELIQALTVFSEEFNVQNKTSYYLTESNGVTSNITDVSDDINKIFVKLAEPLHNLVWN